MANTISLINTGINSGTAVKLLNGEMTYGWKNRTLENPTDGTYGNVESQFSGWENPIINTTFYIPIDGVPSGHMTWALWNQFVKNAYDGTAGTQTKLTVTLGDNDTPFLSYAATSAATGTSIIPVQIKSFNLRFSPADSNNAAFWTINAQLVETK